MPLSELWKSPVRPGRTAHGTAASLSRNKPHSPTAGTEKNYAKNSNFKIFYVNPGRTNLTSN